MRGTIKDILRDIGLSEKETELYIFISKKGTTTATEINRQLKLNRGQSHRLLKNLQSKGMVEITLEYPTHFIAVPFERIVESFIRNKQEEVNNIEKAKQAIFSDWKRISQKELDSSLERFSVIEGKKKILKKMSQMLNETNGNISFELAVTDLLKAESFGVFDSVKESGKKINSSYQVLTEFSKQNLNEIKFLNSRLNSIIDFRARNPSLGAPPLVRMVISDDQEIILFISKVDSKEDVCLSTNCKSLIQSFNGIHLGLWQDSVDIDTLVNQIETGKSLPKTKIIENKEIAKKTYNDLLNSAHEIVILTSSNGLNRLLNSKHQIEEWSRNGKSLRIMAPITNENLEIAQQLLKLCEIRHISLGYFDTTIIDGHHLFQFKDHPVGEGSESDLHFQNTYYTNDIEFIEKTKNIIMNIWRNAHTPLFENVRLVSRNLIPALNYNKPLENATAFMEKMKYSNNNDISENDVLSRIISEQNSSLKKYSDWSSVVRYFGSRAFAAISPPKELELPNLIIVIFHITDKSSFGAENWIVVNIQDKTNDEHFIPVAFVQNSPKMLDFRKKIFANFPVEQNMHVFKENQIQVLINGTTFYVGWTKPIPLGYLKKELPPSSMLFESYGQVKPGMLTNFTSSGRIQEIWYNSFDAFVNVYQPRSNFVIAGTEAFIERETLFISKP